MRLIRIAVAVITCADGRMLVVRKRGTGAFMQPGGKIEPGELPVAALVRELREELGLDIDPLACTALGRFTAPAAFEADGIVEAEAFRVATLQTPAPQAEIEEVAWVDAANTEGLALAQLTQERILPLLVQTE